MYIHLSQMRISDLVKSTCQGERVPQGDFLYLNLYKQHQCFITKQVLLNDKTCVTFVSCPEI